MFYAGIGSRKTPEDILKIMKYTAGRLKNDGYTLRSGGAKGADTAFESGAGDKKEIFRAKDATEEAIQLARAYHPAWNYLNDYAKKLMGRNTMIILGADLKTPVEFCICWTDGGGATGGTGHGMRICQDYGIDVFNFYDEDVMNAYQNGLFI